MIMINRLINHYLLKHELKINPFMEFSLRWMKRVKIEKINWIDQLDTHQVEVLLEGDVLSKKPSAKCDNSFSVKQVYKTALYTFDDALIHPRSSNFLYGSSQDFMIDRVINADLKYCDYSTGYIRYHNQTHALIKTKSNSKINKYNENTLYIGGNGVYNYYHWLIEIAPKLLLITPEIIEKYSIKNLILDQSIKETPSLHEILTLFIDHQKLELNIIYKKNNELSLFKRLYYINHQNNFVFNSKEKLSSASYSYFSQDIINKIRNVCLQQVQISSPQISCPEKIFLARKANAIRGYNQSEILEFFEQQGFTALYLEDYSFSEQVKIFNHAKFVVGPTGAAWSNIIFSQPETQALSWLPEQISEFSVFSTLAALVQCDMRFLVAQAHDQENPHSDYSIDLSKIIELYQGMKMRC